MTKAWANLAAILAIWLIGGACQRSTTPKSGKDPGREASKLPPRAVKTVKPNPQKLVRTTVALGALHAHDRATLSAKVAGRVKEILVDVGSQVKAGDLLAQIDPRDYELKVQQAEAALAQARVRVGLAVAGQDDQIETEKISSVQEAKAVLDEAKANYDRIAKLQAERIISQAEVETAASTYGVALNRYQNTINEARERQAVVVQRRAELMIARQQLADSAVRASFDGAIQDRRANLGEYLTVGAPVVTLVGMNPLRLRTEVAERDVPKIRLGQEFHFFVEGDTNAYRGTISRISPAINEENRMLIVEADIPNPGWLHPGSFVRSEILIPESAPALTVPLPAILSFAGIEKVFIVRDGKALERQVSVGDRSKNWVEILSGITAEDRVILNPGNLRTGQPLSLDSAN